MVDNILKDLHIKHKSVSEDKIQNESGVAIIIALLMLLVMAVMGITISFYTNIDFFSMQNYKQGQEAFLAAERCIIEARQQFENTGIERILFEAQGGLQNGFEAAIAEGFNVANPSNSNCDPSCDTTSANFQNDRNYAYCRTGPRNFERDNCGQNAEFISIPEDVKTFGRPIKHVSLPSGGRGGATLFPITFIVTGKDRMDEDKCDLDDSLDTGVELAGGIETFVPGGASNVY